MTTTFVLKIEALLRNNIIKPITNTI